jgi:ribonuclease HI
MTALHNVTSVWTDGGVLLSNPSRIGGTAAFRMVDAADNVVLERCFLYVPFLTPWHPHIPNVTMLRWPHAQISNNVTELEAVLQAFFVLPGGWSGTVYSDSKITLGRVFSGYQLKGIDADRAGMLFSRKECLGSLSSVLVAGHPTQRELSIGYKDKKLEGGGTVRYLVSRHNVACDQMCTAAAAAYLKLLDEGTIT